MSVYGSNKCARSKKQEARNCVAHNVANPGQKKKSVVFNTFHSAHNYHYFHQPTMTYIQCYRVPSLSILDLVDVAIRL